MMKILQKTILFSTFVFLCTATYAKDMTEIELLTVSASGLSELKRKVSGRDDVFRETVSEYIVRYTIKNRFEAYYFTTDGHQAHPTGIFRGRVKRDDRSEGFDQRAWSASKNKSAIKILLSELEAKGFEEL
jgi:hypothetical protein